MTSRSAARARRKEQYGCRGWVLHHNTDLWRGTAPINNIDGIWPTGGAWLCYHLWEHYLFTGDKKFLADAPIPAMKGASLFFVDFLVKDPKTGWLVTSPSFSPEQGTLCDRPDDGQSADSRADEPHDRGGARFSASTRTSRSNLPSIRDQLAAQPDRQARPAPGMARGRGRAGQQSPAHVAAVGVVSRRGNHAGRSETIRRGQSCCSNGAATAAPAGVSPGAFRSGRASATANSRIAS